MALHPRLYRVTCQGFMWGQVCMNVIYLLAKNDAVTVDQIAATAWQGWIQSARFFQGSPFQWTQTTSTYLGVPNGDSVTIPITGEFGFWNNGDQGFGFLSQVISLKTGTSTRSTRGRIYIPAASKDLYSNGVGNGNWTTSYNNFKTRFESFFAAGGAMNTTADLVVYSKKLDSYKLLTAWGSRNTPAIQRRRNIGVGI